MGGVWTTVTERTHDETGEHAIIRQFRLDVVEGVDVGASYTSQSERATIGTDPGADLVLRDPTVSRFHCEIELASAKAVLRDLSSKNGTFINGLEIFSAPLVPSARIGVGRSVLLLTATDAEVKLPLFPGGKFGSLIGSSGAMRTLFARLERAAAADAPVLLLGETGVGKDSAAESIHQKSARKDHPFVTVNCGAPTASLERELFGDESTQGALDAAAGGTIFLDSVGELSLDLQARLLTVLARRDAPARFIAASNRNLRADINEGRFRPELYFRIGALVLTIPPLRERPDDIPPLVRHFLESLGVLGLPVADALWTRDFLAGLARHSWPGNVRELRNHLENCIVLESPALVESLGVEPMPRVDATVPLSVARLHWTLDFERRYVAALLQLHGNNVTQAARAAGVARVHLHRLMARTRTR
jgi:DNA-binding NtrC family response regulator